jgi:hypothetical protein
LSPEQIGERLRQEQALRVERLGQLAAEMRADSAKAPPIVSAAAARKGASRAAEDGYVGEVWAVIGATAGKADVVTPLAEAVRLYQGQDTAATAAAMNRLVAALLAGPDPSAVLDEIVPEYEIQAPGAGEKGVVPGARFGNIMRLALFPREMWELAKQEAAQDAGRASQIARAAVVLSTLNDFDRLWEEVVSNVINEPEATAKLLRVSDADFQRLTRAVKDRVTREPATQSDFNSLRLVDRMTAEGGQPAMADIQKVLTFYDTQVRKRTPQLGYRYSAIAACWHFLQLMKVKGQAEGEAATRAVLSAWKKDFPAEDVVRWVDQALTREGPVPEKQLMEMEREVRTDALP